MTEAGCTVAIDHSGTTIKVAIGGEFDLAEVESVRAALRPFAASQMDVDLESVTFMDSSGLQCLLQLHGDASAAGGCLVVRTCSVIVERLLQLSGTGDELFDRS